MALDEEVEKAVIEGVRQASYQENLAKRIISWLREMSEKDLSSDEQRTRIELTLTAIKKKDQ
jgi:hypothetical protein